MTTEHESLSADHGSLSGDHMVLDGKLDEIKAMCGVNGDCSSAWSKIIPDANDRFKLVMGGAAVLDHETCPVWEQSPDTKERKWENAVDDCYVKEAGGRKGWRAPTVEELATLIDVTNINPSLPGGHPFSNVQTTLPYWTSTTSHSDFGAAFTVNFYTGSVDAGVKFSDAFKLFVWCVRGGKGHDGVQYPY